MEIKCDYCSAILSKDKTKARIANLRRNQSGKVFCDRLCKAKFFNPESLRHVGTKFCHGCKKEKPKSDYYFANKEKTRYAVDCKICVRKRVAEYIRKNPDRHNHVIRRYKYGIEPEEYEMMINTQSGKCAICGYKTKLCVDHNHATKKIRGLLCNSCNKGLGLFADNVDLLKNAINYIQTRS